VNLSVIIPTFNRRESLRRTLDGLARQTYSMLGFEVIVVSDGSTDGTEEMLAAYAVSAPYVLRPISQANAGPSAARNRGIREARHEIIVFLDDDVEPVPEFLARHAAHHENDDKIVVLGPMSPDPTRRSEEPVWIAWEHAKLQETYAMFRPGGLYAGVQAGSMHFYSGNASVRRRWLNDVGGFNEAYTRQEDGELAARLAAQCGLSFEFDFQADGLHRPQRTFESWLRIPNAYGALDAERVRQGQLDARDVERQAADRNRATRLLTSACVALPGLLPLVMPAARGFATALHSRGQTVPALAILSGLYNAAYAVAYWQETARGELKQPVPLVETEA
jgi:glycosyltransferase involved in cell wall biosynthesis